jgi:hypothetical protein
MGFETRRLQPVAFQIKRGVQTVPFWDFGLSIFMASSVVTHG